MENEKETKEVIETQNSEKETIIIEEVEDDNDDNEFLKSLENIDNESKEEESNEEVDEQKKKDEEEALKLKNKNAEEARKRRESEAKAKAEAEAKAKEEAEKLSKEKEEKSKEEESKEVKPQEPQEQVRELTKKYPDLDLAELDKNEDFQEYLQGKWVKGGKTITEIYEGFVNYKARLSKQDKAEVEKQYQKKSTPGIKGSGGGNGGNTKAEEVYSQEELKALSERMPYMTPQEYDKIEAKFDRSVKFHKKK